MFSNILIGAAGFPVADLGDEISQSLRFTGTQNLTKTMAAGAETTFSCWVKIANLAQTSAMTFIGAGIGTNYVQLYWEGATYETLGADNSNTSFAFTSNKLRDPSAWYHLVYVRTSSDTKIYINGAEASYRTSGTGSNGALSSTTFAIGSYANGTGKFEGYMADVYFVESVKQPSDFGRYQEDGVWVPKNYTGTYGTNGFHLDFADSSDLGNDVSGNNNDFTASGFDTSPVGLYSANLVSSSGAWLGSNTPDRLFDSSTSTYAQVSGAGETMTFTPTNPISYQSLHYNNFGASWELNGTTTGGSTGTSGWQTIDSNPGTLTTLKFLNTGGGQAAVSAIAINGTATANILVDNIANDVDFLDTPTSNYATLNPLNEETAANTNQLLYEANLKSSNPAWGNTGGVFVNRRFDDNDNYYFEIYIGQRGNSANQQAYPHLFWKDATNSHSSLANSTSQSYWVDGKFDWDAGDVLRVRTVSKTQFDVSKNGGTFKRVQFPMTDPYRFGIANSDSSVAFWNFGQMPFLYDVPDGYSALQTNNLPEPTIKNGKDHFETIIWDGNSVDDRNITTTEGFAPDFVWIKRRNGGNDHGLFDSVRGATKRLVSNENYAEDTQANDLQAFNSDGFQVGNSTRVNGSGNTYAAWCWKAGGTATTIAVNSITASTPSIASSVSANTNAGFSIVSYTGTGANATVGHGLNSAPECVIVKSRDTSQNWAVFHTGSSNGHILTLNTAFDRHPNSNYWQSTDPSSSVVTLGSNDLTNKSGDDMIMYAWHSVEGFSKFGSFEGNSSSDGPFVYTGHKSAFLMIKNVDGTGNWMMLDTTRQSFNPNSAVIYGNQNTAEYTGTGFPVDFLSNGFKIRVNDASLNTSGQTYVYMSFAENPFGGENAPPVTAR